MKQCKVCYKFKNESEFSKHSKSPDRLSYWCKFCQAQYDVEQHLLYPWKRIYCDIKTRCNNIKNKKYYLYGGKGIKCLITVDEIKELWFRDKAWLLKRPSIDRKDSNKNYTIENCQFIELSENSRKPGQEHQRPVLQFDLNEKFIKEWNSAKEIEKCMKFNAISIRVACRGLCKTMYGYIWKYKMSTSNKCPIDNGQIEKVDNLPKKTRGRPKGSTKKEIENV